MTMQVSSGPQLPCGDGREAGREEQGRGLRVDVGASELLQVCAEGVEGSGLRWVWDGGGGSARKLCELREYDGGGRRGREPLAHQ